MRRSPRPSHEQFSYPLGNVIRLVISGNSPVSPLPTLHERGTAEAKKRHRRGTEEAQALGTITPPIYERYYDENACMNPSCGATRALIDRFTLFKVVSLAPLFLQPPEHSSMGSARVPRWSVAGPASLVCSAVVQILSATPCDPCIQKSPRNT